MLWLSSYSTVVVLTSNRRIYTLLEGERAIR